MQIVIRSKDGSERAFDVPVNRVSTDWLSQFVRAILRLKQHGEETRAGEALLLTAY